MVKSGLHLRTYAAATLKARGKALFTNKRKGNIYFCAFAHNYACLCVAQAANCLR